MNEKEYKLSNTEIPELYKIKSAHHELIQAYAESPALVSRLSFVVGMNEIQLPKDSTIKRIFFKIIWGKYSPLRIFTWRPVVSLFVEAHLHQKLRELITGYSQFKYLVVAHHPIKEEYLTWLDKAKGECRELLDLWRK